MAKKKTPEIIEEMNKAAEDIKNEAPQENVVDPDDVTPTYSDGPTPTERIVDSWNNVEDVTKDYKKADINENKGIAILGYFGILVLLPIIFAPKSKFARYHANQALLLLITNAVYWIVAATITALCFLGSTGFGIFFTCIFLLLSLFLFVLWVQGLSNAANGKAKALPFIGKWEVIAVD